MVKLNGGRNELKERGVWAGVAGYDANSLTVGEVITKWAPGCELSKEPKMDKNAIKMNKHAIKVRATTAKEAGALRRTDVADKLRIRERELLTAKSDLNPRFKPTGEETFGMKVPRIRNIKQLVRHKYLGGYTEGMKAYYEKEKNKVDTAEKYRHEFKHTYKSAHAQVFTKMERLGMRDYDAASIKVKGKNEYALTKEVELDSMHRNYYHPQPRGISAGGQKYRPCFIQPARPVADLHT